MALSKAIYKEFESIVGAANISQDKGIVETYRNIPAQSSDHRGPFKTKTPLPHAVILPGSTEEVQGIVKLCNKYKIQFKASSTFWSTMGYIGDENSVQIDMRRMRGFEIDANNMFIVCEPYVIAATAQAETLKYGLNMNIPGIGCSSSPVASAAGWVGFGPQTIFMGAASENFLGAEWVLPNGEILRTGTLGAGSGWFCGEGPGPSVRAILRGKQGTAGSFGICTKLAIRLHPWPGPTHIPSRGQAPAYKASLPENFRAFTLCFPDWDAYSAGLTLLHQAEILYLGHRQFNMFGRDIKTGMLKIITDPDGQLAYLEKYVNDPETKKINDDMKIDIQVVIAGMTKRDTEYKLKVLDVILEKVGGWKNAWMATKEMEDYVLMYLLRMGHKNLNFVLCGAYEGNYGLSGNVFVSASVMEEAAALKAEWEQKGTAFAAVGGDSDMGSITITGGGGTTGWEFFTHFDAYEKESVEGTAEYFNASQEWMNKKGLGLDMSKWNETARRADGNYYTQEEHNQIFKKMPQPGVAIYQYKVREAFNPNNLCGTYYRTLDPASLKE